jgi:hypothetical protein
MLVSYINVSLNTQLSISEMFYDAALILGACQGVLRVGKTKYYSKINWFRGDAALDEFETVVSRALMNGLFIKSP